MSNVQCSKGSFQQSAMAIWEDEAARRALCPDLTLEHHGGGGGGDDDRDDGHGGGDEVDDCGGTHSKYKK